jgi:predicted phage-related endonuclease
MGHYINSSGLFQAPDLLKVQADIISTPEDLQADDAAVSALMMESDINAPIKEQCEENARLMREIVALKAQRNNDAAQYKAIGAELAKITLLEKKFTDDLERVKAQMDALECENCRILTENAELQEKAKKYEDACKLMAKCLHDLEG